MRQLISSELRLCRLVMSLWLMASLCVASIPRCDTILGLLGGSGEDTHAAAAATIHACHDHETSAATPPAQTRWVEQEACACTVLNFLSGYLPHPPLGLQRRLDLQPFVLVQFLYGFWLSDAIPRPDFPPPRYL